LVSVTKSAHPRGVATADGSTFEDMPNQQLYRTAQRALASRIFLSNLSSIHCVDHQSTGFTG
jgi:hypothetical protein